MGVFAGSFPPFHHIPALASHLSGALLAAAMLAWMPWPITVVDGDTVDQLGIRYRLTGYDAPEIRRAACADERVAGRAAQARLQALIASGGMVELRRSQWRADRYGRVVGRLTVDGRDIAAIAITEGWGRPYDGRSRRETWCPGVAAIEAE